MILYRMINVAFKCDSSQQGNNFLALFAWMYDAINHLSQFNNFYNCFKWYGTTKNFYSRM